MVINRVSGKASSIPVGLMWGAAASILFTFVLSAVLAVLIDREKLSWENIGYGIMLMLLVSSFLGAKISCGKIKRQRLLVCVMSALVYWGILFLITALFFGGQYHGVGVAGLIIFCGSVVSGLLYRERKVVNKSKIRTQAR